MTDLERVLHFFLALFYFVLIPLILDLPESLESLDLLLLLLLLIDFPDLKSLPRIPTGVIDLLVLLFFAFGDLKILPLYLVVSTELSNIG